LYPPAIKALAAQMLLEGGLQLHICQTLGRLISRQLFDQWLELYQQTKLFICDPSTYKTCGRPTMLTPEDCTLMVELVRSEPGLFLEEIREQLYDSIGTLLSFQAIHDNLVNKLSITLKKPSTVNFRKDLVAKWAFVKQMYLFPAEFLVFVGKLSCFV
jgi:hypothetical protein